MKFEKWRDILREGQKIRFYDNDELIVGVFEDVCDIPPFLDDVEVKDIQQDNEGTTYIFTDYKDQLAAVQYLKDQIQKFEEDISDDYRYDNIASVFGRLMRLLTQISDDAGKMYNAISLHESWNKYIDEEGEQNV